MVWSVGRGNKIWHLTCSLSAAGSSWDTSRSRCWVDWTSRFFMSAMRMSNTWRPQYLSCNNQQSWTVQQLLNDQSRKSTKLHNTSHKVAGWCCRRNNNSYAATFSSLCYSSWYNRLTGHFYVSQSDGGSMLSGAADWTKQDTVCCQVNENTTCYVTCAAAQMTSRWSAVIRPSIARKLRMIWLCLIIWISKNYTSSEGLFVVHK